MVNVVADECVAAQLCECVFGCVCVRAWRPGCDVGRSMHTATDVCAVCQRHAEHRPRARPSSWWATSVCVCACVRVCVRACVESVCRRVAMVWLCMATAPPHRVGTDPSAQRDVTEVEEGGTKTSDLAAVGLLHHTTLSLGYWADGFVSFQGGARRTHRRPPPPPRPPARARRVPCACACAGHARGADHPST